MKTAKLIIFITFLLVGQAINHLINSPKINWFMSLVDSNKRGSFTAMKERVSLIGGMLFSLAVGTLMDKFEEIGDVKVLLWFAVSG